MPFKSRGVVKYHGEEHLKPSGTKTQTSSGEWVRARALGLDTIPWRLKCIWLVWTGKADIVVWDYLENNWD